ncbi:MAG TPA: rhodanese-like domain-containing protein [Gemmatimonadaceae bacterium]|nr:rhodanese-like domain-containing protein [Gemmatimonadaceae bacterium]
MLLKRFYDDALAQASYLVGCDECGEALIVDPNRDVAQYVDAAAAQGMRISCVTETHIHADFVSGSLELARRTGARLLLSALGGRDWQYTFAAREGAELLREGSFIQIGNVRVDVIHTPGHTPEHLTFLVTDRAVADRPMGALTGDFIFVGDVGRPDLLEKAAHMAGTMERSARELYASLERFATRPDYLQLWPGHGAGSACGKALGAVPQTTLGYEKMFNWAFQSGGVEQFVSLVLAGQPEPPSYFAEMKRVNRDGPRLLGELHPPERLPASRLREVLARDALVVDTRHAADFAAGHVPGVINIPLNRSFTTWAGWLLPYDRDLYLIVSGEEHLGSAARAARQLAMIGLDRVSGYFGDDVLPLWLQSDRLLETVPQMAPREARDRLARGEITVLDVRTQAEWDEGHIAGAQLVPLGHLAARVAQLPRDRPILVHCQGGGRSSMAASVLLAGGVKDVVNLAGGMGAWEGEGFEVERDGNLAR